MIHHAVVWSLPAQTFKAWMGMLCLAKDGNGTIPKVEEIAFQLRCGEPSARRWTEELVESYGLLERNEDGTFRPHNWERHQYKSDNVTERVRAFRERSRNVSETPPEYRVQSTETEAETESGKPAQKPRRPPAHFSSLTVETLPEEYAEYSRQSHGWDADRSRAVFEKFRDHHLAHGSTMKNWLAAWRTWCRNECKYEKQAVTRNGTHKPSYLELLESIPIGDDE
jgi:hypothetical protein